MSSNKKDNLFTPFDKIESWEVTHDSLQYLTQLANQSITLPTDEKDQLFEQFNNTIYSGFFDTLNGGIIIDDKRINVTSQNDDFCYFNDNHFCKELAINVSMCRMLFAADRVFYHGQFRVLAKQILNQILITNKTINLSSKTNLFEEKDRVIRYDYFFNLKNSNIRFLDKDIKEVLELKELELFKALAFENTNDSEFLLLKNTPLEDACNKINMHTKEGQIIEHSLIKKLNTHNLSKEQQRFLFKRKIANFLIINCELIEACIEGYHAIEDEELSRHAHLLFYQLKKIYLKPNAVKNDLEWLALICTGIKLMSIDFSSSMLTTVISLITNQLALINQQEFYSPYHKDKCLFIINFLNELPAGYETPESLSKFRVGISDFEKQFDFIFIDANAVDQRSRISQLRSRFNIFQTIIVHR